MAYIYPKTIETTTGHSIKHATQNITNPHNLCSDSTKLAYWGVKTPTYKGNYMRNWPDSITTISGSYYDPETIYATDWDVGGIANNAIVKKITIQYKWEQVSYSCGTADCYGRFDKPTLSIISENKTLASFSGAKPEAIRYNNNKTDASKMNTNNAELKTLRSHTIDVSSKKMTIKDLKKMKLKFNPAKNTYHNHCRIIMQFIRIKITYEDVVDPTPAFRVTSSIKEQSAETEQEWTYTCKIKTSNKIVKPTQCSITINDNNTKLISTTHSNSDNTFKNGIWSINHFNNNEATIVLKFKSSLPKTVTVTSTIQKYADSVNKKATSSIKIIEPITNMTWDLRIHGDNTPYIYADPSNSGVIKCIELYMNRDKLPSTNEYFIIDTNNWLNQDKYGLEITSDRTMESPIALGDGKWKINNLNTEYFSARFYQKDNNNQCPTIKPGDYTVKAIYYKNEKKETEKTINIVVTGPAMDKEYFKLRLEDGSDVRYNSLMFTQGDDLIVPLTYDIVDENESLFDDIEIIGETIRLPTNEAHYTTFNINVDSKSKMNLTNILSHLEIYNENGDNCSNVIIGVDEQMQLFEGGENKYCVLDSLKAKDKKKFKFIIQSDEEQICYFKLKPFNYDKYDSGKWILTKIIFKDMPNIKLSICTDNDTLNTDSNKEVTIDYCIENLSNIDGGHDHYDLEYQDTYDDALKFKIIEPTSFKIKSIDFPEESEDDLNAPTYNNKTHVITFPYLKRHEFDEATQEYTASKHCLHITYEATQKGIYDFSLNTYDDKYITDDDQYQNSVTQKIFVDINSNVEIHTKVSNRRPYVDELIDYTITVKNFTKNQNKFTFMISDIGLYNFEHTHNDYELVYVTCEKGEFTPSSENNIIGNWEINDIKMNDEFELVLTLRPKDVGYHTIQTIFNQGAQDFEDIVNVLERNKQIDFNVHQAIDPEQNEDCINCNDLTIICDEDYINVNDYVYYVFEITNNNRNDIETTTHIYCRLPPSFLTNGIDFCSDEYKTSIDEHGLVKINIPYIKGCESTRFCIKVQPTEMGTFKPTFMLTNRNASVYHQQLTLNVDVDINSKKLEHEINIYNFEKTNRYFRYELDGDNNIFKFFNQGDKSLKLVDLEKYNKSAVETFKGTNLKDLVRQIKNKSKYVEPELLRIGANKLASKGYELYPDGFMRRFGLFNSEIFHHTGQLPQTSNLADRAMRWDQDRWETKVWGGGIYDNGVFDVSIDYDKIPKNFNLLDINNPMTNLQTIVDKVKPFGTQALCYYASTILLDMHLDLNIQDTEVNTDINIPLDLENYYKVVKKNNKYTTELVNNFGLISTYNRHDNSLATYFDMFHYQLTPQIKLDETHLEKRNDESLGLDTDINITTDVFTDYFEKKTIIDCLNIIENLYTYEKNIDIIQSFEYIPTYYKTRSNQILLEKNTNYTFYFSTINNINIVHNEDIITIKYVNNEINNFKGFIIQNNDTILFKRNIENTPNTYNIQIQQYVEKNDVNSDRNIIHIWLSLDNNKYYHIGYLIFNDTHPIYVNADFESYQKDNNNNIITFQINDSIKQQKEEVDNVIQFENKYSWKNIENINNTNKYASFSNDIDIDPNCKASNISVPTLGLLYNNIHINDTDEIKDISLKIKANTNKKDFIQDINVNICKDGESYIPYNHISTKNYYPSSITNVYEDFSTHIIVKQPNITICSNCLKTSLGLYDVCPYCDSELISHYDEKKQVTICDNCSYISNGWYNYCPHCLSESVTKTMVDFNKTYCYNCYNLENDYYPVCPKCFSSHVEHLTNDEKTYEVGDKDAKNIDTITIKSDTNRVNICNIEVPLNINVDTLEFLEYLSLHIHGNNYNDGKFYYCSECHTASLGHPTKCEECNNTNIEYYEFNDIIIDIYSTINNKTQKIKTQSISDTFDFNFDLIDLASKNKNDTIILSFYVENQKYNNILNTIDDLEINEDSYDLLINSIPLMHIDFDNIYYDYKYLNEKEWQGLKNLQQKNHTSLHYKTNYEKETKKINLNRFNVPYNEYEHIYLTLCGFNKSDAHINADLIVFANEQTYNTTIDNIGPNVFKETIDLTEELNTKRLDDLSIQLSFSNIVNRADIYITDCFITTEKKSYNNIVITDKQQNIIKQNKSEYLIQSFTDDIWNINKEEPYYIAGRHLHTGLACFIDFGTINATEYIRLYNAELIISYKNTYGKIITESIPIIKEEHNKYLINANIQKNNAETWGSIKIPNVTLNNLESKILNNENEKALNSIPLITSIAQSFLLSTDNINTIHLNYDGHIGYPNESIIMELYTDDYNTPGEKILSKDILLPLTKGEISINIDIDNLTSNQQYWIVLKDVSADKNNYHKFKYNDNINIGNLVYLDNNKEEHNIVLSFGIDSSIDLRLYYDTPTSWDIDIFTEDELQSDYKLYQLFYRYNSNTNNNVYLHNLSFESGYTVDNDTEVIIIDNDNDEDKDTYYDAEDNTFKD